MAQKETEADQALIRLAAEGGYSITARQLRRWRAERLLPTRSIKSLGRGAGVKGLDPVGTADQLLALCRWHRKYPRSADKVAISLWYDGWPVPTQRVRTAILRGPEQERAKEAINWDAEPLNPLEKMAAGNMAQQDLDPAERLSPTQLIRDARADLSSVMLGDPETVNEELISGYFQLERLNETLPDDGRPKFSAETAIRAFRVDTLIEDLRTCSPGELEAVRAFLRSTFEGIQILRGPSPGIDLNELPPIMSEGLSKLEMNSDTRHPEYDAGKLFAAIGSTLALLRKFDPSRLEIPQ